MAKTAAQPPKPAEALAPLQPRGDVAAKAAAVAQKVAGLRADLGLAHELAHQAQVREALTRTELTLALGEALKARAEAQARLGLQTAELYFRSASRRRPRRPAIRLQRVLLRLGPWGEARLIAASGLWQGQDLAEIAAYARRRADPTARPKALFDQAWYLATNPQAAASGRSPLGHYLTQGAAAGLSPHPLFDARHYAEANAAELNGSGMSPLAHFLGEGSARGRDPHPLFDIAHYVSQEPDLAAGEDPVSHYVRAGWREGLAPHPLFDGAWYRRQMPRAAAEVPPLVHYVTTGWRDGLSPHPLFDPRWYLEQNDDVAQAGFEPLAHFLIGGAAEGRSPSPWFDLSHYVAARGEGLDPAVNPLVDYLQGGAWAVAEARPGFPTAAYLAATPELVGQGMTPLEHWARKAAKA